MEQNNNLIRLTVPHFLPNNEIEGLISDVKQFKPQIEQVRPEPFAANEWIVPTAIIAYVAKPYFEAFLGKAGKDHYIIVKGWLKKLAEYSRAKFRSKIIAAIGSELKISNAYTQSSAVSVFIDLSNNKRLKLLFDVTLSESDWNVSIDKFFDLLADHYEHFPNDDLTLRTKDLKGRFCYGVIDRANLDWLFLDDKGMSERLLAELKAGHDIK